MIAAASSTPYGLPARAVEQLLDVLTAHSGVERIVLYGSRANGAWRPGSDIDLCLVAPAMTLSELLRMGSDIDELLLPWKVDLGLWHQIDNQALRDHIQRVGVDLVQSAVQRSR